MASFIKLTDHLGSVYALTDSQGRIAAQYRYDEFGIPVKTEVFTSRPLYNPLGYTGEPQHNDPAELIYLRQRYYAPQWGRFLSRDPIYISPVFNYTGNNPLRFNDPSGLNFGWPPMNLPEMYCDETKVRIQKCIDTCVQTGTIRPNNSPAFVYVETIAEFYTLAWGLSLAPSGSYVTTVWGINIGTIGTGFLSAVAATLTTNVSFSAPTVIATTVAIYSMYHKCWNYDVISNAKVILNLGGLKFVDTMIQIYSHAVTPNIISIAIILSAQVLWFCVKQKKQFVIFIYSFFRTALAMVILLCFTDVIHNKMIVFLYVIIINMLADMILLDKRASPKVLSMELLLYNLGTQTISNYNKEVVSRMDLSSISYIVNIVCFIFIFLNISFILPTTVDSFNRDLYFVKSKPKIKSNEDSSDPKKDTDEETDIYITQNTDEIK